MTKNIIEANGLQRRTHSSRVTSPKHDIENLANAGESQVLEFKQKLTSGPDIAKAAVSFANTGGGQILLGVTDEGKIVGMHERKIADTIQNIFRAHCDPPLLAKIQVVTCKQTPQIYKHPMRFLAKP